MTKKLTEEIRERRREVTQETAVEESQQLRGKWVTDRKTLNKPEIKRVEDHMRRIPKRLAASRALKLEDAATGLVPEEGEVTDRVTQRDIVAAVDGQTQRKRFDLALNQGLGPYAIDFSVNGTHLALMGLRGHMAVMKWQDFKLEGELQLRDRCTDVKFLVDHSMLAVAQKRFVYMYTKEGVEMHVLPKMANMDRLEYLHKHFLLVASSSLYSTMSWIDVSTGKEIGMKPPAVMREPACCLKANPANGVVATADVRGVVKLWSPVVPDPLVQLKAHTGPIQDISFHINGRHFVTLGTDHKMKIWDSRTLRALETYGISYTFNTIDISTNGLLAMGGGTNVQIWKDVFTKARQSTPYMKHGLGYGNIAHCVRFCPFEDILGIGHSNGFGSILVPGSGEANPDFYYANPYETEIHRKERVVTSLLDKLPADTISMDLQIGNVDEEALAKYAQNLAANRKARNIREKKARRVDMSEGEKAPTGLRDTVAVNEDEVDEELGAKERGATRLWKSKRDKEKERKMAKWARKDTSDKVRSKQTMRHSRQVQKERHNRLREAHSSDEDEGGAGRTLEGGEDNDGANVVSERQDRAEARRAAAKKEHFRSHLQTWGENAALSRFS